MSFATDFLKQLQEGNTSDAIDTIKESLKEKKDALVESQRSEILSGYGFVVEKKDDDDYMDEDENDHDDESDDGDEKEQQEEKKEDKKDKE